MTTIHSIPIPEKPNTNMIHVFMLVFVYMLGTFMGFLHDRDFDLFITMIIGATCGSIITSYVLIACTD